MNEITYIFVHKIDITLTTVLGVFCKFSMPKT